MLEKMLSVILLLGGQGTRMGAGVPKQYLKLNEKIIALYSFDFFCAFPEAAEIIVVCEPQYRYLFETDKKPVFFAFPGILRQESVLNGLKKTNMDFICIHDGARPFLKEDDVRKVIRCAGKYGAAALGSKAINTLKQCNNGFVEKTLDRESIYEIYTPQIIKKDLLEKGFDVAEKNGITVTDDLSLVEMITNHIKIVDSSSENIKITTPEDLKIAKFFLES